MVRCDTCGAVLEERPCKRSFQPQPDGFWEMLYESRCPYCESPHLSDYDPWEKDVRLDDGYDWRDGEPVHEECLELLEEDADG